MALRRLQPIKGDGDQPTNGLRRRQLVGCAQGMEAVTGELVGLDIGPDGAGSGRFEQQVPNEADELLLGSADVLASVEEAGSFSPRSCSSDSTPLLESWSDSESSSDSDPS